MHIALDGLKSFGGTLIHSAQWNVSDETMDQTWKEKNVAVIGNVCQRIAVTLPVVLTSRQGFFGDTDRNCSSASRQDTHELHSREID